MARAFKERRDQLISDSLTLDSFSLNQPWNTNPSNQQVTHEVGSED